MEEGRCLYCGGLGHMARECPNAPEARRPFRAAAIVNYPGYVDSFDTPGFVDTPGVGFENAVSLN